MEGARSGAPFQEMLAEYCEGQAVWRDRTAEEHPEGGSNAFDAETLREFAGWVRGLSSERLDLTQIEALIAQATPGREPLGVSGEEARRVVSRIGFSWPAPFEDYLAAILTAVWKDYTRIGN